VPKKKQTIYVGLSGGVDSSVSAALLKDQGYDVVGVFIRTWQPDFIECTWRDDRRDAMRVAAHLDIPFRELDLEKEYKKYVADYMIDEYKKGRTPNPDVMCNREIKFGGFLKWALAEGADFIATGHYAQIIKKKHLYFLKTSKDKEKDQTYFLWKLNQKDLSHTLFPVGGLNKTMVRKLAQKYALPTATKKDSQGVCMLGALDMKKFLTTFIKTHLGNILSEDGEVIGTHDGALLYTVGERHGLLITHKDYAGKPYYVVSKNLKDNTVTVTENLKHSAVLGAKKEIRLTDSNFVTTDAAIAGKKIKARSRYRAELHDCQIFSIIKDEVVVRFVRPELTASAGQSLVLYDGNICLGGGIIA
jgi:tRNA-uridine 2-sulfurtransferase